MIVVDCANEYPPSIAIGSPVVIRHVAFKLWLPNAITSVNIDYTTLRENRKQGVLRGTLLELRWLRRGKLERETERTSIIKTGILATTEVRI